jgi:hypothetical protein
MSKFVTSDYMASWPKAVPFPYSISRSTRPVPNSNAVNWPQSQFAPLYLSPGSPSFQPYSYFKEDVPLKSEEPEYLTANFFPYARSGVGPGGDTSALPNFGDPMSRAPVRRKVSASSQAARVRAKLKSARKRLDSVAVDKLQDRLDRLRAAAQNENTAVRNTYRMGMINTGVPIESGVPNPRRSSPPPSHMVPNRSGHSATGLDLGDGFAYELAPLQAQVNANFQHRTATDLGNLAGDCDCGGRSNPSEEGGSGRLLLVGGLIGAGIAAWYLTSRSTV